MSEPNSKRAKINMSRADSPHAFSWLEHNSGFTKNKIHLRCFQFTFTCLKCFYYIYDGWSLPPCTPITAQATFLSLINKKLLKL